jgi:hypothetical protein
VWGQDQKKNAEIFINEIHLNPWLKAKGKILRKKAI